MYPVFSRGCLLGPGMAVCVLGAQVGSVLRLEGMGWAAEFLVSAGSPGKGKLTFVKSPLCLSDFTIRTTLQSRCYFPFMAKETVIMK